MTAASNARRRRRARARLCRGRHVRGRAGPPRRHQDREPEAARQPARAAPLSRRGHDAGLRTASASPRASTTIRCRARGRCCSPPTSRMPSLPTVLGYGHGDVIRGLEDQWTKGKGPWITARDGDRLYGRGTADNKGQHTLNMAALDAVRAERGGTARLQCQVHHRDGRGSRLQGPGRAGRRPQGGFRGRRARRLGRPAREAGAPDHDARLPRRHQLRSRLRPARGRAPFRQLGRPDRQSRR